MDKYTLETDKQVDKTVNNKIPSEPLHQRALTDQHKDDDKDDATETCVPESTGNDVGFRLDKEHIVVLELPVVAKDKTANGRQPVGNGPDMTTDSDRSDSTASQDRGRATWGGKLEFLLTCVGYAVGLGNVWRFPYLCYKNGGGAFLIPYCVMLAMVGLPLFFMELSIGQFASLGPISLWKINPLFKGVGYAAVIVDCMIGLYYNVIVAQCIFYFFASMTSELPWTHCNNTWNTANCTFNNETRFMAKQMNLTITTPTQEYYRNYVLERSDDITDFGSPRWKLVLCLLLAWVIVCLVLIKGIQSLGKVVYFTALFPYAMLTVLLLRGITLDGAMDGISFYLEPNFEMLKDPRVWSDAATQIFYSMGLCAGGMMAMSSYNSFTHNYYRDTFVVAFLNCGTSIFAGLVIFSILGFIAKEKGVSVADVATDGPGLAFEVYPEALAQMPVAPLWSVFFFLMMLTLGFGSEFSIVECLLSAFADEFPDSLIKSPVRSVIYRISVCLVCFLLGIPMVCNGGIWLLNLIDYSVGGFPLLIVGLLEFLAINWIYGFGRFAEDIEMMLGHKPGLYWNITWKFITPSIISITIIMNVIFFKEPTMDGQTYPLGYMGMSWTIALLPMSIIVVFALYEFCCQGGGFALMRTRMQPSSSWGPANTTDRQQHKRYQGDFLPLFCAEYGRQMRRDMTHSELEHALSGLTAEQSEAVVQVIAQSHASISSMGSRPVSVLALSRSNGSVQMLTKKSSKTFRRSDRLEV